MKENFVGTLLNVLMIPLGDFARSVPADHLSVISRYGLLKKVIAIALNEPHFIEKGDYLCNCFSVRITIDISDNYCGVGILPAFDRLFGRCLMTIALSVRSRYDSLQKVIAQIRNYFPADRLVMTLSLLQSWVRSSYLLPECFTPTDTSETLVLVSASPLIGIGCYHFHQSNISLEYFYSISKWSKFTILLPLVNSLFTEKTYE